MKTYIIIGFITIASCKPTMNVPKTDCQDCPKKGKIYQGKHGKK